MNQKDKDLKILQKEVIARKRSDLSFKETLIWKNLEEQVKQLRNHIENDDKLIVEQQKHIKEQQLLIENQCKVIHDLVKIGKEQQEELINQINKKFRRNYSLI